MRTAERSKIAKLSDKSGLPPGTPVYTGERSPDETKIRIFLYNEENYEEKTAL